MTDLLGKAFDQAEAKLQADDDSQGIVAAIPLCIKEAIDHVKSTK